ncbi:MAG: hypothetical protein Q8755_03275, partial [Candidatus Phytoplasma australasiaticum]|nr:hypothetical protein [Candidatus Phytoplasma australasiaticum]
QHKQKLLKLPFFGIKKINNILEAIESSKQKPFDRLNCLVKTKARGLKWLKVHHQGLMLVHQVNCLGI